MYFHTPDITYTCIGHPRWIYVMIKKIDRPLFQTTIFPNWKKYSRKQLIFKQKCLLQSSFQFQEHFHVSWEKKMFGPLDFLMFFFLHFFLKFRIVVRETMCRADFPIGSDVRPTWGSFWNVIFSGTLHKLHYHHKFQEFLWINWSLAITFWFVSGFLVGYQQKEGSRIGQDPQRFWIS